MRPKGTISEIDRNIAMYFHPLGMGVVSMFCVQARVPMIAIEISDQTMTLRPGSSRWVKVWMIRRLLRVP